MKSKEELKRFFENGDIPKQEEFWEWQESYWHKDEKISIDKVDYDFSKKADLVDGKVPVSQLPDIAKNDTLEDVILRGNDTTKPIVFHKTENRAGELYFNPTTYSMSWGGMNSNHTGAWNVGIGYNSLANLTTSTNNVALGHYALEALTTGVNNIGIGTQSGQKITTGKWNTLLGAFSGNNISVANYNTFIGTSAGLETTTGNQNTFIGDESGNKNVSGTDNTFLGVSAGYWLTNGVSNTFLGSLAGVQHGKPTNSGAWGWNTFVGYNAGSTTHAMGTYGDNNVVIGANAPLGPESNMLVIHSMTSAGRHDQTQPFIKGSFTDKWLEFDASLKVRRLPIADSSFTQNLVAKPDGTFGLSSKPYRIYTALLDFNQTTFEPAIKVLENTLIGDIVWTRLGTGQYEGKLAGGFSRSKTWIHVGENQFGEKAYCIYLDNNTVLLKTVNMGGDTVDVGSMFGIIEIRVYQ